MHPHTVSAVVMQEQNVNTYLDKTNGSTLYNAWMWCEAPRPLLSLHTQELFQVNHQLLNAIGVGHPSLDTVCAIAMEHGLAAKLTGAGGGGCAIVLIPNGW